MLSRWNTLLHVLIIMCVRNSNWVFYGWTHSVRVHVRTHTHYIVCVLNVSYFCQTSWIELHIFEIFHLITPSPLTSSSFVLCQSTIKLVAGLPSRPRPPATAPGVSARPPAAGCSKTSSPFYSVAAPPPSPSSCTAETERVTHSSE